MTSTMQRLGLNGLSQEDRLVLAEELWDSVAEEVATDGLTAEQEAELDRRLAAADADPGRGKPWDDVIEAARARWRK